MNTVLSEFHQTPHPALRAAGAKTSAATQELHAEQQRLGMNCLGIEKTLNPKPETRNPKP